MYLPECSVEWTVGAAGEPLCSGTMTVSDSSTLGSGFPELTIAEASELFGAILALVALAWVFRAVIGLLNPKA